MGRGRVDTGRNLCAGVCQSAGDQQLREPGPRQLLQLGTGGLFVRYHRHPDLEHDRSLRDAADDNFNAFDPYPPGHTGELNDQDYYDAAGALILPVDRMRRYVTPADINGTGSVVTLDEHADRPRGPTPLAGSNFYSYYRPPGSPGSVASYLPTTATPPATLGAIYYPSNATGNNFFYTNGPNNNPAPPAPASALPIRHSCPT